MHLALLRLETLRAILGADKQTKESTTPPEEVLNDVVERISDAHRRLASMMRATAPSAPHRLEREGMMNAIHTMLEQDFQLAFDEVEWRVSEETANCIDEVTPPAIAELIFGTGVGDVFLGWVNAHDMGLGVTLRNRKCQGSSARADVEDATPVRECCELYQRRRDQAAPAAHESLICFGIGEHRWRSTLRYGGDLKAA